ncbi:MAG: YIP1 family protein [Methanoregulaceae archaeon]|nr:YIP1 family protein [Methanoregulaceae archaeon]
MPLDMVEKVKGFLLNPVESFQKARGDSLGETFLYFVILLVIYAILAAIVSLAVGQAVRSLIPGFPGMSSIALPFLFVGTLIGGIIGVFIGGAWLHLWVYIFGGRKGIMQTIKTVMYGSTPTFVIGWIPIISIIGAIWSFILVILGIRELHEISTGAAVLAVAVAIIIIPAAILLLLLALLVPVSSTVSYLPIP